MDFLQKLSLPFPADSYAHGAKLIHGRAVA